MIKKRAALKVNSGERFMDDPGGNNEPILHATETDPRIAQIINVSLAVDAVKVAALGHAL